MIFTSPFTENVLNIVSCMLNSHNGNGPDFVSYIISTNLAVDTVILSIYVLLHFHAWNLLHRLIKSIYWQNRGFFQTTRLPWLQAWLYSKWIYGV